MSQHHLDSLFKALTEHGWKLVSSRTPQDQPYDAHAWILERGNHPLELHFSQFGGMGEDLELHEAFWCKLAGHEHLSLSIFHRLRDGNMNCLNSSTLCIPSNFDQTTM